MFSIKKVVKGIILDTQAVRIPLKFKKDLLTILCFHGVTQYARLGKTANYEGRHIHKDLFADTVRCLLKYFNPITIKQLDDYYYGGQELPKNPILFTFDDGFANNYHHAFPVLKRFNCPATVFLATGYIDNKAGFWVERLEFSVHNTESKRLKIGFMGNDFDLPLNTPTQKETAYLTLLRCLKGGLSFSRIEETVQLVCEHLGFPSLNDMQNNEDYCFLTWAEVMEMAASGISFGAHTVNHVNLIHEDKERAKREIQTSKQAIERHLGKECIAFCYPFGRSGYNIIMEALLKKAGFKFSFQLGGGLNDQNANPFLLNRIPMGWESKKDVILWNILRS